MLDVVQGRSGGPRGWPTATAHGGRASPPRRSTRSVATPLPEQPTLQCGARARPVNVVRLALAVVDDVRRVQQAETGIEAAPATRSTGSAVSCAALTTKARARLEAGLVAGDPDGEVTIAWTIAQRVMA